MAFRTILASLTLAALTFVPAQAQDAIFPLTVEHALGEVIIPAAPQRVVALMDRDVDTLLALGIKPVAVRSWYNFDEGAGPGRSTCSARTPPWSGSAASSIMKPSPPRTPT